MLFRWKRKFIFIFLLVVFLDVLFFFLGYKIEKLSRWGGSVSSVSFSSLRKPGEKKKKVCKLVGGYKNLLTENWSISLSVVSSCNFEGGFSTIAD